MSNTIKVFMEHAHDPNPEKHENATYCGLHVYILPHQIRKGTKEHPYRIYTDYTHIYKSLDRLPVTYNFCPLCMDVLPIFLLGSSIL